MCYPSLSGFTGPIVAFTCVRLCRPIQLVVRPLQPLYLGRHMQGTTDPSNRATISRAPTGHLLCITDPSSRTSISQTPKLLCSSNHFADVLPPVLPSHAGFLKMAPKMKPVAKVAMKATPPAKTPTKASKKKNTKVMKATPAATKEHKDRNKARYAKQHKHELPEDIQKLLDESGSHEQGRIINRLVVKDANGQWSFKTDDSFVQECMSDLSVTLTPVPACGRLRCHRSVVRHRSPPPRITPAATRVPSRRP